VRARPSKKLLYSTSVILRAILAYPHNLLAHLRRMYLENPGPVA
jgi:hypothetical protein